MITEDELNALVGTPFPGGQWTVDPYFNWLTCDCVLAPQLATSPSAHPLMVYMAGQAGLGLSLEELFELCAGSSADGPMLGEWGMQVSTPLTVGATYTVSGGITAVTRKTGKKTGVFDIVEFQLTVSDSTRPDEPAAVITSSFIYPRRG